MTNPAPAATAWLEEQLQHAVDQVGSLSRDVTHLQRMLAAREQDANELRDLLLLLAQVVQRQESAEEAVRDVRQAVSRLDERLNEESSLRREQDATLARSHERRQDAESAIERLLVQVHDRLAEAERGLVVLRERQGITGSGIASHDARETQLTAQVEALAVHVQALIQSSRRPNAVELVPDKRTADLQQSIGVAASQAVALVREQRRLAGEVAALRHLAEREESLSDVTDQLRMLRQRIESGLATLEARVATVDDAQVVEAEERRLLRVRIEALERRVDALNGQLDGDRDVLLQHFGRATETAEAAARRQAEEIARQTRVARELLVRLREGAEEASREQPL